MNSKKKEVTHLKSLELAERLRVHPATPGNWRMIGKGPKWIKPGRDVLYSIKEVERWEREDERSNTAQQPKH